MSAFDDPLTVKVFEPDSPFAGVRVTNPDGGVKQLEFVTGSPVLSVFGRIGNVVAECTDYARCYAPFGSTLPGGGSTNQVLTKLSADDFDFDWLNVPAPPGGLPVGGVTGQILAKLSNTDFDAGWENIPEGIPSGGTTGQVLTKATNTDFDADWETPPSTPLGNPTALVGLTPVDGVSPNALRSDGAPALDQGIIPTWTGYHVFSLGADSLVAPVDPFNLANKAYVDQAVAPTGSGILTGCGVAWDGTGFNYTISAGTYLINGTQHSSALTHVTLAPADPVNDRIDVFYVDVNGLAGVITGTPGGPPLEPQVNPATQLKLTSVTILHATTTPSVTLENIYLENTEWNSVTNSAGTINLASTNNPFAGTKDIEATNAANLNNIVLTRPSGTVLLSDYVSLVIQLRFKTSWPNPKALQLIWFNGSTVVTNSVLIKPGTFGLNGGNTTSYQQVVIPTSLFSGGSTPVNKLQITVTGSGGSIGFYLDNILLQGGTSPTPVGGDFSTNTNVSVAGELVLFNDATGKLGKRSTGTGLAKLTAGVLGFGVAGTDFEVPLAFADSLNRTGNSVNLDNDNNAPGNSMFYGTSAGGAKGWYALPSATTVRRNLVFSLKKSAGIATGKLPGFWTCPFTGTISGWNITVDAGTITLRIWKIATGTNKPTVANNINTSGLALSTGTAIRSSTVTDFTTLAVTAGDIFAVEVTAVSGVTEFGGAVEITQS